MSSRSEQLRVGYVLKRFPRFSETFILNELLALQSMGVSVDIFSLLKPPEETRHATFNELTFPIIELGDLSKRWSMPVTAETLSTTHDYGMGPSTDPLFSGKSAKEIVALHLKAAAVAAQAQVRGITHLHAHFGSDAATVALLAARLIEGSFSFTAHARDIYHTYVNVAADQAMRRAKIKEATFVTTVSDYNAAYLKQLAPTSANHIIRLYNGIDLSTFSPVSAESQQAGRILSVGRLVEKKGFSILVQACAELRARGVNFECRLIGDGPLHDALASEISHLNLQDSVFLDGALPQEKLIGLMDSASLAVLPCIVTESGDRDGLPTVLLEAMAKALPIVTTTVSGGPEIVDHERTGLLCEPGNPKALADALEQLLVDSERARAMGLRGRDKALQQFDLKRNVSGLRDRFLMHCEPSTSTEQFA